MVSPEQLNCQDQILAVVKPHPDLTPFCNTHIRLPHRRLTSDLIATLSESTASTFLPSLHAKMVSHPEGRQIMRDRPIVSSQTVDLDKLRGMKRGTLGREYVEWLERGDVTPDTRADVSWPAKRWLIAGTAVLCHISFPQTRSFF